MAAAAERGEGTMLMIRSFANRSLAAALPLALAAAVAVSSTALAQQPPAAAPAKNAINALLLFFPMVLIVL